MPRASRSSKAAAPSVGLDVVEIARVRSLARRNPRFLSRVFSEAEIEYCRGKKLSWQHFAVRFAAKEAIWKAVQRPGLRLKDIEVRRDESGRPYAAILGKAEPGLSISLSHSEKTAMAVALALPK